jgi:hypothetical protein
MSDLLSSERKKYGNLFPRISDISSAAKTIKEVSYVYFFVGALAALMAFLGARNALVDIAICISLGLTLFFFKSRISAITMGLYSITTFGITIYNNFNHVKNLSNGGTNIFLSIIVLLASLKAIEATFKYHKYRKLEIGKA